MSATCLHPHSDRCLVSGWHTIQSHWRKTIDKHLCDSREIAATAFVTVNNNDTVSEREEVSYGNVEGGLTTNREL